MKKVSWIILTYGRNRTVETAFIHNLADMGLYKDDVEIIWVDNGSPDKKFLQLDGACDTYVDFAENQGVAKGYNAGYRLATGEYVVITGCDRLMPDLWLNNLLWAADNIPNTGIVSVYSQPIEKVSERKRSEPYPVKIEESHEEHTEIIQHALPFEARIISRELFNKIGYLREDFGLYSHEDCEWAYRAERVTKELGLRNYILPAMGIAEHLGTEGVKPFDGKDDEDYHAFKARECKDPWKEKLMSWCRERNWPYYNPYEEGQHAGPKRD